MPVAGLITKFGTFTVAPSHCGAIVGTLAMVGIWRTVRLMTAAVDVQAVFTGCVAVTLTVVVPAVPAVIESGEAAE